MIKLGVNIDHIATLREVRKGMTRYPDLHQMALLAMRSGGDQITIHLREDRRHIQDQDVKKLCHDRALKINLEMAATEEMVRIAKKNKPDWVCFVPEKREELTTEGGLNVAGIFSRLEKYVGRLQSGGIEISMFIEPDLKQVEASFRVGADAVEFHTGKWVLLKGPAKNKEWKRLVEAAKRAHQLGLRVHAGHGLDYKHSKVIKKLPHLVEVNIGHFLVCESLQSGWVKTLRGMKKILKSR